MSTIREIAESLRAQDNRSTVQPIFAVRQRRRIYGMDPDYAETIVWLYADVCEEVEPEEAARLEAEYQSSGEEPGDFYRTGYLDIKEFVTACFTEAGAQAYIDANRHELTDPEVYAYGSYRNAEWQAVRELLLRFSESGEVIDYVGIRSCGCCVAWVSGDCSKAEIRQAVNKFLDDGLRVQSLPTSGARALLTSECPHEGD